MKCLMVLQGYESCGNVVEVNGGYARPCEAGLRIIGGEIYRLIYDIVLSRPEDYLSIYQSCCNHRCLFCHSWYFSQRAIGTWMSPRDIVEEVLKYRERVTVWEPRDRATSWHAHDLCAHCGLCATIGERPWFCPRKLRPEQVVLSPQGYGPARNIVSFTGGDLFCRPEFYAKTFKLIKREAPDMWIHIETNGWGLTPKNLEILVEAGLDSVWLDMKAFRSDVYRELCGTDNRRVLELPAAIKDAGLVLEIVLLYIPGYVEEDQLHSFAELIAQVDPYIPVTLIAFFPEFAMLGVRTPTLEEMIRGYKALKSKLHRVRIGNASVFCRDEECLKKLVEEIGRESVAL